MGVAQPRPCEHAGRARRRRSRVLSARFAFAGAFASAGRSASPVSSPRRPWSAGDRVYIQDLNSNVFALVARRRQARSGRTASTGRTAARTASPSPTEWCSATPTRRRSPSTPRRERALAPAADRPAEPDHDRARRRPRPGLHEHDRPGAGRTRHGLRARPDDRRRQWRFDTIAEPWRFPKEASGGGAWYPPSVDSAGRVYVGHLQPVPVGRLAPASERRRVSRPGPATPTRSSCSTARPASSSGTTR